MPHNEQSFAARIAHQRFNPSYCPSNSSSGNLASRAQSAFDIHLEWLSLDPNRSTTSLSDTSSNLASSSSITPGRLTFWSTDSRSSTTSASPSQRIYEEEQEATLIIPKLVSNPCGLSAHELDDLCISFVINYNASLATSTLTPTTHNPISTTLFRSICIINPLQHARPIALKSTTLSLRPTRITLLDPPQTSAGPHITMRRDVDGRPGFILEHRAPLLCRGGRFARILAAQADVTDAVRALALLSTHSHPHPHPQKTLRAHTARIARAHDRALLLVPAPLCEDKAPEAADPGGFWRVAATTAELAARPADVDVAFGRADGRTLWRLAEALAARKTVRGMKVRWGCEAGLRRMWCVPLIGVGGEDVEGWCCFLGEVSKEEKGGD